MPKSPISLLFQANETKKKTSYALINRATIWDFTDGIIFALTEKYGMAAHYSFSHNRKDRHGRNGKGVFYGNRLVRAGAAAMI